VLRVPSTDAPAAKGDICADGRRVYLSPAEVLRWLRGEPSVLSLQATTTEEVVAFFHATLSELPGDVADAYRARCLVATTAAAARALANAPTPLILLLTEPEPGLARSLARLNLRSRGRPHRTIYLAGQTGIDANGKVAEGFHAQAVQGPELTR
jgi:hypothetical protein